MVPICINASCNRNIMKTNRQLMHIVNAMSPIMSNEEPERFLAFDVTGDSTVYRNYTSRCCYEYWFNRSSQDVMNYAFEHDSNSILRARWFELVEDSNKIIVPGVKTCFLKYAICLPDSRVRLLCLTANWFIHGGTGDGALSIREATLVQ